MKKTFTIIITLLILLTGCSTVSNDNDDYTEMAIDCCLSYLYREHGYDVDNSYTLKKYLKSEEDQSVQAFVLYENNDSILFFTLEKVDEDPGMGLLIYDGNVMYSYSPLETNALTNYPIENSSTIITSDRFILESVDSINMNTDYQLTDPINYQAIQDLVSVYLNYDEPVTVTVYEHLNVINVNYDKQTNSIICSNNDILEYPILINGQAIELVQISSDYSSTSGSSPLDEDHLIVKALNDKIPFVIACASNSSSNGIVIRSDETIEITAPVILKKAYSQLLEEAKKMSTYQELFTFTFNND